MAEIENVGGTPGYYLLHAGGRVFESADLLKILDAPDYYEVWCIGNALKYLTRAGRKTEDPTQDIEKGRSCLEMALRHRAEIEEI